MPIPYDRPTFELLRTRIGSDLAQVPAVLRGPLSSMWSKTAQGIHGHLDWIDRQASPLTCSIDRLYDWAGLYSVPRLAATAATGNVQATGTAGASVLADAVLRANGLDYTIPQATELGIGDTPVAIRCTSTGAAGNLAAGQTLTLVDPLPGVSSTFTVAAGGIAGGAEDEDVEAWRVRVVDEWQTRTTEGARGGRPDDYKFWAKSAHPSVSGALVQVGVLGAGTVVIRPYCNDLPSRMPTQQILDAVAAYFAQTVPATADWSLTAPIQHAVVVSLDLDPSVDTAPNRAAITAAINASVLAEGDEDSVLRLAEIDVAIATVTADYTRAAPLADIAVGPGEILVLEQPITWL